MTGSSNEENSKGEDSLLIDYLKHGRKNVKDGNRARTFSPVTCPAETVLNETSFQVIVKLKSELLKEVEQDVILIFLKKFKSQSMAIRSCITRFRK